MEGNKLLVETTQEVEVLWELQVGVTDTSALGLFQNSFICSLKVL